MRFKLLIIVFLVVAVDHNVGWRSVVFAMQAAPGAGQASGADQAAGADQAGEKPDSIVDAATDSAAAAENAGTLGAAGESSDGNSGEVAEVDPDAVKVAIENYKKLNKSAEQELPWDYSPYKVLIWLVSDSPEVSVSTIEQPLRKFLDRDYCQGTSRGGDCSSAKHGWHGLRHDYGGGPGVGCEA